MAKEWYQTKKFNKIYLFYMIGFLGSLVLLLSPANQYRLVSDEIWNSMNLIEKLLTSIPVVSKSIINITSPRMPLAYILILVVIIKLIKNKDKISKLNIALIILNMILIYIFKNDWLYFSLVILLFVGENYPYLKNKEYNKIILSLAIYAIVYFNILTPTYAAGRPNYYYYMYIILLSTALLNEIIIKHKNAKKICYIVLPLTTILLLTNEIYIYKNIGTYHQERLKQIEKYKENNNEETLYLIEIPKEYGEYHMDINLPNKAWFNYESYINYYDLPKGIEIEYTK